MKVVITTALALVAFAGNSVLCRRALGDGLIDASSFTAIRLVSGILVLLVLVGTMQFRQRQASTPRSRGSWSAAVLLFVYALAFSYAYNGLGTGMGALILFTAVQITMVLAGVISGRKLLLQEWLGLAVAFTGLVYLLSPGIESPPLQGFLLMSVAGVAWGLYSLAGRESKNPLSDTAYNFLRCSPLVGVLVCSTLSFARVTEQGVILAVMSGALASGLGYTVWYMALPGLTAVQAAVLQLSVPVIATAGGIVFVGEVLSARLAIACALILGGILLVILAKTRLSANA